MKDEENEWTIGVPIGAPGYGRAAAMLLLRWSQSRTDVPPDVALAIGYLIAGPFSEEILK